MTQNPVRWFEIYVQDMGRAQAFYEAVFRQRLETLSPPDGELEMLAFPMQPDQPGTGGALVRAQGIPSGGNSTLVYFACDDCAVEAARVTPAGGRVMREKMPIGPYGFVALAHDTEGNLFGLHSMQ